MSETVEVQPFPFRVDVVEGCEYRWCACGRSRTQPLCDDSHKGTGIEPQIYKAETTGRVQFCGCKKAARARSATTPTIACEAARGTNNGAKIICDKVWLWTQSAANPSPPISLLNMSTPE